MFNPNTIGLLPLAKYGSHNSTVEACCTGTGTGTV